MRICSHTSDTCWKSGGQPSAALRVPAHERQIKSHGALGDVRRRYMSRRARGPRQISRNAGIKERLEGTKRNGTDNGEVMVRGGNVLML